MLGLHGSHGAFHIKAGFLRLRRSYFAAKVNANYPENGERFGLPTIQGVVVLCDAENGRPLAMMDSAEITARRTAAATAVAAKYLARPKSAVLTVCGCGVQGHAQVRALAVVLPLRRVFAYDTCQQRAAQFAEELGDELAIEVRAVADLRKALLESDVGVTCTTSRKPLLTKDDVPPGIFLAAVGADHPEKQELDPALMAAAELWRTWQSSAQQSANCIMRLRQEPCSFRTCMLNWEKLSRGANPDAVRRKKWLFSTAQEWPCRM
jgi:ornithine cyclodeaminase/alanine dehydrogenase-like protein (mu-crystallin family)